MGKKFIIKVRGEAYEVEVDEVIENGSPAHVEAPAQSKLAAVAPTPAPAASAQPVTGEKITAPIPGTILGIPVKVGDKVKAGQVVVILEAMKLENEICTFTAGEVKQILVTPGATVSEGTVLVVVG